MKLGVFTQWIKADTIEDLAQRVHELDLQCVVLDSFPGLQINLDDPEPEVCARIKSAFARAGVEIAAVGGYCNLGEQEPAKRAATHTRFKGLMRLCQQIGSPMLCSEAGTYHPTSEWEWDPANGTEQAMVAFIEAMRPLVAAAEHYGITIGMEPYVMTIINSAQRAARLIEVLHSDHLKLVYDPAGLLSRTTLLEQQTFLPETFRPLAPYIGLVHVEDCRPDPQGHFLWLAAGKGLIEYPVFMDLVVQSGYDGPLILEHLSEADLPIARQYVLHHWQAALERAHGRITA